MLSPPLSGTSDAIETAEHTAFDRVERGGAVDPGSPIPSGPPLAGRKSKARVRCTWKGCDYKAPDADEMNNHTTTHRRCPKRDCSWAGARDRKEERRHVWYYHKAWAESTGYTPMSAQCDECSAVFTRADGLSRHKKEVHGAVKRVRKSGG